ncbi:MAG: hypothetical protein LBO82_06165 [Synergistaceae bacterium]|jgi:hypothetical protein|nr:hypothetical protein [Synergistaceae bacterium]
MTEKMKTGMGMKKRSGSESGFKSGSKWGSILPEVLIAACILGAVLPPVFSAFGSIFMSEVRVHEASLKAFGAEWWFNRLELPVSAAALDAMPREDERGRMRFRWETEKDAHGALRVTLSVSGRAWGDVPLVTSRVFP